MATSIIIGQAMILAAGRGERMRPLTDNLPKPLVEVAGRSMLDRIIDKIEAIPAITKIVINAYYLAELLEKHVKSLSNPKLLLSRETSKLETGGGLVNALPLFDQDKPILLVNGDIVWEEGAQESAILTLINNFKEQEMDVLLGLVPVKQFRGYEGAGDFNINLNDTLKQTSARIYPPEAQQERGYAFSGIQIIHPRILKYAPSSCFSLNYFYKKEQQQLVRLFGTLLPGKFFHIGTVEALKKSLL